MQRSAQGNRFRAGRGSEVLAYRYDGLLGVGAAGSAVRRLRGAGRRVHWAVQTSLAMRLRPTRAQRRGIAKEGERTPVIVTACAKEAERENSFYIDFLTKRLL